MLVNDVVGYSSSMFSSCYNLPGKIVSAAVVTAKKCTILLSKLHQSRGYHTYVICSFFCHNTIVVSRAMISTTSAAIELSS